jgi:Na+:H+ antiporter, NhaA family
VERRPTIFGRLPRSERLVVAETLRQESVGGALLLIGALLGLFAANFAADWYADLSSTVVGPTFAHLDLSLSAWAADGLLAIFFFVAGLEVKRELVVGTLSTPSAAALPMIAAVCGMVVPALLYLAVAGGSADTRDGWGVPMATDIAFAVAVLAIAGSQLPNALRAFLLTLAVVDDLGAILVIALFYTDSLEFAWLLGSLALLAVYAYLQRRRVRSAYVYIPLALAVWTCMHASGIHATVAGVALGLLTRIKRDEGEKQSPGERLEHRIRPLSAGLAVPVFAFFAAGIALSVTMFADAFADRAAMGVVLGLVVGKVVGIFGGTWLAARFTRATLDKGLTWLDVLAVSVLAGVGFTVSLLISELAFADQPVRLEHVKAGVLVGSLIAAVLAVIMIRTRVRAYARLTEEETSA